MNRDKLRTELMRDEGVRLESYKDSVGLWTIGVGHLLGKDRRMTEITSKEMHALLDADIRDAEFAVEMLVSPDVYANMSDARQRVLVNMAFNLGSSRFAGFKKLLQAVHDRDWTLAAAEMMDSKWAQQVGPRATRLRDMMLEG